MSNNEASPARDFVVGMLARPPFHQWLQPRLAALDPDNDTLSIVLGYRAELSRSPDQRDYHGGIIASLIDMTGHACLAAKLRRRVPTIDMRIDYLRTAVDSSLTAVGRVLRAGRSIGLCDVQVFDDANRLVAVGRCVYSTREG